MYSDMERTDQIRVNLSSIETGALGAYVDDAKIFIPNSRVTCESDGVHWETHPHESIHLKVPTRAMLDGFIELWRSPDTEVIRSFLGKWGPLRIAPDGEEQPGELDQPSEGRYVSRGVDSYEAWRFCSRRAYSILRIAAKVKTGEHPDESDLATISRPPKSEPFPFGFPSWSRREHFDGALFDVKDIRDQIVTWEINYWLRRFALGVHLVATGRGGWRLGMHFERGLLSAIALQLALALMRLDALFICSGCKKLYERTEKKPNSSEKNYCRQCKRLGKPTENAEQNRRARRAQARRLHAEGSSVPQIVKIMKVRSTRKRSASETVKSWIAGGGKQNA
jgi:hypothetical protein